MALSTPTRDVTGRAAAELPLLCPVCGSRYPAEFKVCPRDAAELSAARSEDPLVGLVLGGAFRIVRAIGEGGTARVYEARHVRLPVKPFAVKVLHAAYASNPTLLARFQREAEAAAGIDHPSVVDVYDVDRAPDGRPYIVTEFMSGSDLGTLLKARKRLDVATSVRILREVCGALSAAHARGIVHRDLKPENVFIIAEAPVLVLKVLDFGISKLLDSASEALTRTGMIVGTPAYMAPEQASGLPVDARTDVYGAGAILYRLVTGRPAFSGGDTSEVLSAVLTEEPRRPRSLEPSIPDELELVIQRALAKEPAQRHQSMQELDAALAPFDTGLAPRVGTAATDVTPAPTADVAAQAPTPTLVRTTQATRTLRLARPSIVLFSALLYLWLLGCSVDAVVAVLSAGAPAAESAIESRFWGATLASALVLLGPFAFWARHVSRRWQSTQAALDVSALVRRVTLAAVLSYAAAVLALRLLMATTGQPGLDSSGAKVSLALLLITLTGAAAAYLTRRKPGAVNG